MSASPNRPSPGHSDLGAAARVEELYAAHAATVRAVCRGFLRDRVEAEDAVQQTFLSAQRALANGSRPSQPAAWLATIARNECLARVRTRMREPLPVDEPDRGTAPDAHADAVRRHEIAELRDALAELPAQQREALLLREVRGLSYDEVAATLAVTTSAVESLLFRARRRLQTRLREALAGVFPGAWAQPLRELLTRVAGSGLAAPAAAKVAAVGLGTAVATGGAVLVAPGLDGPSPPPPRAPHAAAATPSTPGIWQPAGQAGDGRESTQREVERRDGGDTATAAQYVDSSESSSSGAGGHTSDNGGDGGSRTTATDARAGEQTDGSRARTGATAGSDGGRLPDD